MKYPADINIELMLQVYLALAISTSRLVKFKHIDIAVFICYYLYGGKNSVGASLKRTTIFLTEDQLEKLRQLAFVRRTSMSHLIREAAMEILEDEEDIREGLRALADAEGTVSWKAYQRKRAG